MFTSVDVSWPGSVHDARIWKNSDIRVTMQQFPGAVLLGDDGYGLEPFISSFVLVNLIFQSRFHNVYFFHKLGNG